jgi:hypothetical protein
MRCEVQMWMQDERWIRKVDVSLMRRYGVQMWRQDERWIRRVDGCLIRRCHVFEIQKLSGFRI